MMENAAHPFPVAATTFAAWLSNASNVDCTDCAAGGGTGGVVEAGGTDGAGGDMAGAAASAEAWTRGSAVVAAFVAGGSLSGSDADKITFQFRFSHFRP